MAKQKKKNLCSDGRLQKSFTFNGKRIFVRANSRDELEEKISAKKKELKEAKDRIDDPTLGQYYDNWVENRRGSVTEATIRSQQCHFNTVSDISINGKAFKDYKLSEIKAEYIRIVQRTLLDRKNSTQTVNDKIAFISHIFHDAMKEQLIRYNPCCPVRPLKKTEAQARDTIHRALTIEETKLFFEDVQNSFYYDVFRMAILTGMRIGEIGALKNSDIHDGMIHINRTITRTEDGGYRLGTDAKTKSGKRTIPLNPSISEVIEHQRKINSMLDGNISGINDLIFKAPERGLLMATPCDREIKRVCKRTGIEHFTCHAFRDTFATRAIEQGIEPRTLQDILGHKDYALTMNLYAHVIDDTKEKAMSKLNIAL